jgi:hypothetical protein
MSDEPDESAEKDSLFERLSEEGKEVVPVNYRLSVGVPAEEGPPRRLAESRFYRAEGLVCRPFHKPVSRCLVPEGD